MNTSPAELAAKRRRSELVDISVGCAGAFAALYAYTHHIAPLMQRLPLGARIPLAFVLYWLLAAAPLAVLILRRNGLKTLEADKKTLPKQLLVGIGLAALFSLALTVVPILVGLGDWVDNGKRYTEPWHFIYEFLYTLLAVGLVEEFIFRAFVYEKLERVLGSTVAAVAISSVLFGLFHVFASGGIVQVIVTTFIGAAFCLCRLKIKGCSFLSLVLLHGVYDFLISVFSSVLNG